MHRNQRHDGVDGRFAAAGRRGVAGRRDTGTYPGLFAVGQQLVTAGMVGGGRSLGDR